MVERATHNRLVTGSNPVGAKDFCMLEPRIVVLLMCAASLVPAHCFAQELRGPVSVTTPTPSAADVPLPTTAPGWTPTTATTVSPGLAPSTSTAPSAGPVSPPSTPASSATPVKTSGPTAITLQGTVTRQALPAASLTATIEQQVKRPVPGPPSKFVAVTLHLNNPTTESLILDGDNATAYYSNGSFAKNATKSQTVADASETLTKGQKVAVALVTIGTATLAGPLFYEWIQGGSSNPKVTMGQDEIRRRVEGVRLGARLMLSNENADGTVFLPAEQGMPSYIVIPVLTYPTRQNAGALRVDIPAATTAIRQSW